MASDVSELPPGVGHAVGWEANQKGKNGPRLMKLQQFLSPQVRAHALPAPFIRYPTIGCGVLTLPPRLASPPPGRLGAVRAPEP